MLASFYRGLLKECLIQYNTIQYSAPSSHLPALISSSQLPPLSPLALNSRLPAPSPQLPALHDYFTQSVTTLGRLSGDSHAVRRLEITAVSDSAGNDRSDTLMAMTAVPGAETAG